MTPGFRQLLNRFAMIGFERQIALQDLLGDDPDWKLSPKDGTVTFNGDRTIPLQILGTRATESNTWLWAWANKAAGLPAKTLEASKKAKQVGKKRSIGELEVDSLPLDNFDFDAHTLAMIATAVADLPAYFRFPYSGGSLFAALDSPEIQLPPPDPERMAFVIEQVIERFDVDHRTAFTAYTETRGAKCQADRNGALAQWPDGKTMAARFDDQGRIVELVLPGGKSRKIQAETASQPST